MVPLFLRACCGGVLQQHRGIMIRGSPYTLDELREFLAYVHVTEEKKSNGPVMKGLATIVECRHCGKRGHNEKQCWKNPRKVKAWKERKCWQCGKTGHLKKDCRGAGAAGQGMAATAFTAYRGANENVNYVDSACSVHIVSSLDLLEKVQRIEERTVQSVGGELIKLTHKGTRVINTKQGPLSLTETYYCQGIKYNLVSAPKLADKEVEVRFSPGEAYLQKGSVKIYLTRKDGLWTIPEMKKSIAASLRMSRGGAPANDVTWHERLGHPSRQKMLEMIHAKMIPSTVKPINQDSCSVCRTTIPSRRPIPSKAERSGQTTVQVDYMPMGREERGWRGEVGAYVYSHRIYKIIKAYPTTSANTNDAVSTLDHYLTHVAPYFTPKSNT